MLYGVAMQDHAKPDCQFVRLFVPWVCTTTPVKTAVAININMVCVVDTLHYTTGHQVVLCQDTTQDIWL